MQCLLLPVALVGNLARAQVDVCKVYSYCESLYAFSPSFQLKCTPFNVRHVYEYSMYYSMYSYLHTFIFSCREYETSQTCWYTEVPRSHEVTPVHLLQVVANSDTVG